MTRIIHMIEKLLTSNQEFQFQLKCSNILYPVSPTEYSYKILMKCIEQLQENADVLGGLGKKIRFGGTKKWQCPLFLSSGIFHPELSSPETQKQVLKLRHRELRRALLLRLKKQERKFLTLGDSTDILHFFFCPFISPFSHIPVPRHRSKQEPTLSGRTSASVHRIWALIGWGQSQLFPLLSLFYHYLALDTGRLQKCTAKQVN